MQYVLLVYGPVGRPEGDTVPGWARTFLDRCKTAGVGVSGALLASDTTATTIRCHDDHTDITHGPATRTAERLTACFTVDCPNLDVVLRLLHDSPMAHRGSVDIRPVDPLSQRMWRTHAPG